MSKESSTVPKKAKNKGNQKTPFSTDEPSAKTTYK